MEAGGSEVSAVTERASSTQSLFPSLFKPWDTELEFFGITELVTLLPCLT